MIVNKYLAGFLTLAISLLTALVAIPETAWADPVVVWQFVALIVSSIAAVFLPLLRGAWAAGLKTGSAVILGTIGALIPLLAGTFGVIQWALLGLAALNALAIELGVNTRVDAVKEVLANPAKSNAVAEAVDPAAVRAAV